MFRNLLFCNNGTLSLIDLTTMGDSSKRDDSNKIGKFDSGLKYALVILKRNGIDVKITSNDIVYTFDSVVQRDERTGKTKEVLEIVQTQGENEIRTPTAFAINMGHEWELWMAVRELYSNCIDEDGTVLNESPNETYDTVIELTGNELLEEIINDWDSYFIDQKIPVCNSSNVSIYNNDSEYLKIYKNGILIYRDETTKSKYLYDYPHASIDEMRVLNSLSEVEYAVESAICGSSNKEFIKDFIKVEDNCEFEKNLALSNYLSSEWIEVVNDLYKFTGNVTTYKSLMNNFMENSSIDIGAKRVAKRSMSFSEDKVIVKTEEKREEVILTFEEEVKKICFDNGFEVTVPVIISEISGMTCIADIHKKVIYVTKEFTEQNIWEIIKAHYRIHAKEDVDSIFKDYAKMLKSNQSVAIL